MCIVRYRRSTMHRGRRIFVVRGCRNGSCMRQAGNARSVATGVSFRQLCSLRFCCDDLGRTKMNRPLDLLLWQNTVLAWLIALGVCAALFGIINLILGFVKGRVATFAQHSATVWDNVLVHRWGGSEMFRALALSASASSGLPRN